MAAAPVVAALGGAAIIANGVNDMNDAENADRARLGDAEYERQRRRRLVASSASQQGRYAGAGAAFGRPSPTAPAPSMPRITAPVASTTSNTRSNSAVVQNINSPITVNGAGNPQETARAIRQEQQAMLRTAKSQLAVEVDD
jgi:hypothetical protein